MNEDVFIEDEQNIANGIHGSGEDDTVVDMDLYIDDGSHAKVFVGENGNLVGQLFRLQDYSGKLMGQFASNPNARMYEDIASAVGRIFVIYKKAPSNYSDIPQKKFFGTGFLIGPGLVLTAGHVVKRQYIDKQTHEDYELKKVYISFHVNSQTNIWNDELDSPWLLQELELIDIPLPKDPQYCTPDKLKSFKWDHINDFAFLKFKGTSHAMVPQTYLFPLYLNKQIITEEFVIGFPSKLNLAKFKKDHIQNNSNVIKLSDEQVHALFTKVVRETGQFEKKVISRVLKPQSEEEEFTIGHKCPTLRGTSGGPLIRLHNNANNCHHFSALHVGGSVDMNNSFAISVNKPSFVYSYLTVLKKENLQFLQENIDKIQQFLNINHSLIEREKLLQGIHIKEDKSPMKL